jgi:hypothetical protein
MKTNRKLFLSILTAILLALILPIIALADTLPEAATPAQGNGTANTPYIIASPAHFVWMRDNVNSGTQPDASYKLDADLIIDDSAYEPIGKSVVFPFRGTFDGDHHTITYQNASNHHVFGLFNIIRGGTVKNLSVEIALSITNNSVAVGGIAGQFIEGAIENCSATGTINVTGVQNHLGGIAGVVGDSHYAKNPAVIDGCYSDITLNNHLPEGQTGNNSEAGAIAGSLSSFGRIVNCIGSGKVNSAIAGGIAGKAQGAAGKESSIENSYSTAEVNSTALGTADHPGNIGRAGGILGQDQGYVAIAKAYALNPAVNKTVSADIVNYPSVSGRVIGSALNDQSAAAGLYTRNDTKFNVAPSAGPASQGVTGLSNPALQNAATWQNEFKSFPWTYEAGKLPVLAGLGGKCIEPLPINPTTIVQGHLSYIHVGYMTNLQNAGFAFLNENGDPIGQTVSGTSSNTVLGFVAPDAPGVYQIIATENGQLKGRGEIEVVVYNSNIWETYTSLNAAGNLVIHFNEPIANKSGIYSNMVTAPGKTIVSSLSSDHKSLTTNVPYANAVGVTFTISGVIYPNLYPSYSFTFTATIE